ncbi:uncharacterized protein C2845_PM03G19300 [Panicum miliaceum]|uniref:Reverse transcriptase Ty1/copia-type domain-containing protein n=1 Tax=Panicum miliaceum TaxID=4540 RepID=A0A3L6TBG6_PANMI|nr:uncharacterized protein C2845_PM03G19300 [Panicum miliaceum]
MTSDLDQTHCQEDSSVGDDPRYKGPLRVYMRRTRTSQEVPGITPESATPQEIVDVSPTSSTKIEESGLDDLPIALQKEPRAKAGMPPPRYGFEHDISNYVSYASPSLAYRAFVASLQSIVIPKDWKEAKQNPKWHEAMLEELRALEKNRTWDLVKLPVGKKAVSCKWVFTVKQNAEGKTTCWKESC